MLRSTDVPLQLLAALISGQDSWRLNCISSLNLPTVGREKFDSRWTKAVKADNVVASLEILVRGPVFSPTSVKSLMRLVRRDPSFGLGRLLSHWMGADGNRGPVHRNRSFLLRASA